MRSDPPSPPPVVHLQRPSGGGSGRAARCRRGPSSVCRPRCAPGAGHPGGAASRRAAAGWRWRAADTGRRWCHVRPAAHRPHRPPHPCPCPPPFPGRRHRCHLCGRPLGLHLLRALRRAALPAPAAGQRPGCGAAGGHRRRGVPVGAAAGAGPPLLGQEALCKGALRRRHGSWRPAIDRPSAALLDPFVQALREHLPPLLARLRPDLVLYNAGVDVAAADTLGLMALTDAGIAARDRFVLSACADAGVPLAAAIGGGYGDHALIVSRHMHLHRAAAELFPRMAAECGAAARRQRAGDGGRH